MGYLDNEATNLISAFIEKFKDKINLKGLTITTSRYNYSGEDRLDITTRSKDTKFSPTWDIVDNIKKKKITEKEYIKQYLKILEASAKYRNWNELTEKQELCLVCFCKQEDFCHRFILATIFEGLGARYLGEIVN